MPDYANDTILLILVNGREEMAAGLHRALIIAREVLDKYGPEAYQDLCTRLLDEHAKNQMEVDERIVRRIEKLTAA